MQSGEVNGGGAIVIEKIGRRRRRAVAAKGVAEEGGRGDEMVGIEWALDQVWVFRMESGGNGKGKGVTEGLLGEVDEVFKCGQ